MYMRDARKPLELSKDDLNTLIHKFEDITETKFNDAFNDQINNFIGIIRETYLIQQQLITNKEIQRELTKLKNTLRKAVEIDESQLSQHTRMALTSACPNGMEEYVNLTNSVEILANNCDIAIEKIKQRKKPKEFSYLNVKQAMATELARELASFGVKITAYRDGTFESCLREFFFAIKGQAGDIIFKDYVADDLFQVIKVAKKNYTNEERFFLLKFR